MPDKNLEDKSVKSVGNGNYQQKNENDHKALRWMGFGIEFVGVLGIFSYGGWWADQRLKTEPWLLVTGFCVAFIGMMYLIYKETSDIRK